MKKPTILKIALLLLFFLQGDIVFSQNLKPFTREYNKQLKGDILVIGNNILNRRTTDRFGNVTAVPNTAYTGTGYNGDFDMRYINIDNGATAGIFSSSSANLTVPNNRAPADPCYRVAYAALYWSATLKSPANRSNINKVKIKVPNTANNAYQDVTGTLIHDIVNSADGINPDNTQAYACFADITSLLSTTNPNGTYTVANVISSEGSNGGTGLSAGWSLFIVYEDSSLPSKAISTFNGFTARAQGGGPNNTTISGFTTIPTGPVHARFAFAALEGDYGYKGDYLQINSTTITPPTRPRESNQNNFFNSSINSLGASFTDRVPNSTNTLGFDTGVIDIDPSSNIIKNNDTSAIITLGTNSDIFIYYFTAFSVDIIAPKVVVTKGVQDIAGNDASNKNVTLGEQLTYTLKFKNEGNDNATSFTIEDKLPINTDFNFPGDIIEMPVGLPIPTTSAGNQYVKYNAATRTLTFTIPNSYVTFNPKTPESTIKFKVKVVDDCSKLTDACSNLIQNTAESHYFGDLGGNATDFGDKSYSSLAGCNLIPQSTNFLVGLDACKARSLYICTASRTISASGGYKSYSWSRNQSGTPVIGTNQTLTVTQPGVYYVYNTANPPCVDLQETITVLDGLARVNPILEYADNKVNGVVPGCLIDGKPLPKIYLCGTNDVRVINTHISGATIVWEKTDCVRPQSLSELCADERSECNWVSAGANGPIFNADTAGYYRVTINSGGCINTYYFNVYKSIVSATIAKTDMKCYGKGTVTVQKLDGYEYKLRNLSNNTETGFQDSNTFDVYQAGTYIATYRLKNVPGTCEYKTEQVVVNHLLMDTKIEDPNVQPLCFGTNGTITASASAGFTNYYFELKNNAGQLLEKIGPVTDRIHAFSVAPGDYYTVEIYSLNEDGTKLCPATAGKYINNPSSQIIPTVNTIEPLTACSDGKYRVSATGGQGKYSYFVDGSTTPQAYSENDNTENNNIIIVATTAKTYTVLVRDDNNCEKSIQFTVPNAAKPTYNVTHTNSVCYNDNSEIRITNIVPNGYTMSYSINNGGTFQTNPLFSNLQPGTYSVVVRYGISYTPQWQSQPVTKYCTDPAQQVIISGPTSAVTASGGVAELAGCTLSQLGGKLRINNAQGGTAPYQYSFDNGQTWQASNEKDVLPGSYILVIRDNVGCQYKIPYDIILDQKPSEPTITVGDPVFNCNGTATSTVTVTNGSSANYSYEYYLDNVANTPITNNVFTNVPSGSHTVSVKYNVTTVSTYSNLLQEDFGKGGYTTTPGINPAYCFEDESTPHPVGYPCGGFDDYQINDGKYAVASSIKTNFGNSWIFAKDHTLPSDPLGRFLCVNVGGSAGIGGILYSKPIKDVIVNQPVIISLWAENLIVKTSTSHADPKLTIQLVNNLNGVGGTETIVATTDTTNPWVVPKTEKWEYKELSLNPGAYNNLSFVIRSYSNEFNGNDVLLDDIWVRQIPKSCIATKDFPIVIDSNKAFTASITGVKDLTCAGVDNGEITISAQNFNLPYGFDYSLDNGVTWVNSKVSPVTATGLTSKTYSIRVRFDASASSCVIPLSQQVKSPTALTVTAQVTTQPTCTTGASITATANGGTPSYQYELRQSNGTTVVTAFQSSNVFTNVPTGSYTVVARDANSCGSPASVRVDISVPTAPTATLAATSDLCYDTTNRSTLVVTATGTGTLTYSLDGAPAQNSNTFTNVGPGIHNILVTDSNNCTASVSNIVIADQLVGSATISKTLDCSSASPDATITVDIVGGTAGFTYKVKRGTGAYGSSNPVTGTSFIYPASTAALYTFEITDSKGCVTTVSATISPTVNPTVTATKVDATCNGASTGSVKLVGAGGSGTYTYLFYNSTVTPAPTTYTAQFDYTGLAAGTYSYRVKDSKGCISALGSVIIAQPTTLTATASANTFTCNTSNVKQAATVTIAVPTTGTAPYQYSFDGGTIFTNTNTLSVTDNGTNQTISYVVVDAKGCKTPVQTITINRLNPPTNLTFTAANVTCTATTTTVNVTAVNGVGTITYSITSPTASAATNTTGAFSGLAAGTYNFRATDANGCYFDKPYTINAVTPISIVGNKVNDALCKGGATGKGTFEVSGNATVGAYTYTVTPATASITKAGNILTLNNAAAGSYTVQVTDNATGCTNSATVIISEPTNALTFTSTATKINCNNDNAQITVTANGGTINYTYAVVKSGATAPIASAYQGSNTLSVDTNTGADMAWDVYVKDANGCITTNTVTITSDALPTVTASLGNQCGGSGSTFTVTATGTGIAPLSYSVDGTSFQTSNVFNLPAGTYTVTVKDGNSCIATAATTLTIFPQLTALASVTKELNCTATPNATITVEVSGGRAPFTYTVRKGTGTTSAPSAPFSTASFTYPVTSANADSYTFVVTDANGCASTTNTTVNPISNPALAETHINPSCDGGSNGSVELTGSGGAGGYTYSRDNITYTPNATFTGLAAGTYTFYVKDGKECVGTISIILTAPAQLAATVTEVPFSCNTTNGKVAGSVTINVTTGTGTLPYQYSFNGGGFGTANTFTLNDTGVDQPYNYAVKDGQGCTITGSGTLARLNPPKIATITASTVTCTATTSTVTVNVTAGTGVGTLQYETIAPSPSIVAKQTSNSFAGLLPGTYMFKVTDANGCYATQSFTINPVINITVAGVKISDAKCFGESTGSIQFTTENYSGTYSHTLTNSLGTVITATEVITNGGKTITISGLPKETYTYNIVDNATGCTATASVVVGEPTAALTITTATATNIYCSNDNSKITVVAAGGTINYSYAVVQHLATAPIASAYQASNVLTVDTNSGAIMAWDVYVKDANGCTVNTQVNILSDAVPTVTATVNQCVPNASVFTITASGTGVAPLTYSIDGVNFKTANTFDVAPGTYTVTVKDKNNCIATTIIDVYQAITASAVLTKDLTCSTPQEGTITITVGGGKGPYTLQTKIGAGAFAGSTSFAGPTFTYNVTSLVGNTYQFLITDSNTPTACSIQTNVITTHTATSPVASTSFVNPTCNGYADGSISLSATGGLLPYQFSIDNGGTFVNTGNFGGLASGSYQYVIRDKNGCDATGTINLANPPAITPTIGINGIKCNSVTLGSFDVRVNIGTGVAPFTYRLYDNSLNQIASYIETASTASANTPVHSFTGLDFGDYYITIVDSKGCEYKSSKLRIEPTPYLFFNAVVSSVSCATGISIRVNVTDGVAPYTYSIVGSTVPPVTTASTTHVFTGLDQNTRYILKVEDVNGCPSYLDYLTPTISPIVVTPVTKNVTCFGSNNGEVDFTVSNYDASVTALYYEVRDNLTNVAIAPAKNGTATGLSGAAYSNTITGLRPGNYTLYVRETNGTLCSAAAYFEIRQPAQALSSTITNTKNANCNNPAQVTLVTIGGTGPYKYAIGAPGFTPAPGDFVLNKNVLDLDYTIRTNWDIVVHDANECEVRINRSIVLDPSPVIAIAAVDNCETEGNFEIEVTLTSPGVSPYSLSVDGGVFFPATLPYTVTGLNSGTHTVQIQDSNACTNVAPQSIILYKKLDINPVVTKELDCTGSPDAVITLNVLDGRGPFTYEVNINGGGFSAPSAPFAAPNTLVTAAVAGTYQFRVTDSNLCSVTKTVTVDPKVKPDFTFTQTPETCISSNDGTVTITATAGVSDFMYSINNGGAYQTSNVFTGLSAGTAYTILVRDSKMCVSDPQNLIITEPALVTGTPVLTTALSCGAGNAAQQALVTVTGAGGVGTYTYSFDGGLNYTTTNTYTTYTAGNVTAYVKDANGCISGPITINVPALNPPKDMVIASTPIYCVQQGAGDTTSTATITSVTDGVGTLTYTMLPSVPAGVTQTGNSFAGLQPGTYIFQVTDSNGCIYSESLTIDDVTKITVAGQLVSNVTCNAGTNGAVRFTASNFTGTYSASVTPAIGNVAQSGNIVNVTDLTPGTYTVVITDDVTGCTATTFVDVIQPTAVDLSVTKNVNANCNYGAIVSVAATGGTPGYRYAFVRSGVTPVAGNYDTVSTAVLNPAVDTAWDVYVLDANDCRDVEHITIATDALPTIGTSTLPYCYKGGPVAITITGTYVGTPMYSIGNGYKSSPDFVLNAPGNYTFYIKDGNGCIVSRPYTLNQELLLKATLTQDYTCAGDASIDLLATQGTLTYSNFEVSFNGGVYTAVTLPLPYTTNIPGTYTFRVTDSQGCQAVSVSVEVTPQTTPQATFTTNNVSCPGGADGSIVITPSNGVAPYEYSINGGTFQPSNIFVNLGAGTYDIVVRDAKVCPSTMVLQAVISQPAPLAATAVLTQNLTCGTGNATQPATVTINVTTGTGTQPYQYSFNNGVSYGQSNTYTTSASGTVTAYVKDANNCVIAVPVSVVVPALNPPTITTVTGTPIWCAPAANTTSTVTLNVTNGVGTLDYEIISPAASASNTTGAANGIFTGLAAGTYIFKVTDDNGCTDQATYTVDQLINITIAGQLVNNVVCNGESNGSVKFNVDNFGGTYSVAQTAGPTTGTITTVGKEVTLTNLPVGTYTIQVTDDITNCTAFATVIVGQPAVLSLTETRNINANCNSGAQVTVVGAGGTPDYKYAFVLGTGTPAATDYSNINTAVLNPALGTNWRAYVIDSKNCETFIPITIATDPLPGTITANVASQCPSATGEYTITVNVGTGVAPYEYNIGNGFQSSNVFTVNKPGTYNVIVKDANQCEVTVNAAVTIQPVLQLDATITTLPGCTITNNGVITASATGGSGTANYNYTLDGGFIITTTPAVFNNVTPGNHIVRVRDIATTCTFEVTVFVAPATDITGFTIVGTPVTCFGGNNGTITASLTANAPGVNDNPVYEYRLSGTTALGVPVNIGKQTSPVFENLEAGDYTVTVNSGRGCEDSEDVRISQPGLITVAVPTIVQYGCTAGTNAPNYATVTVGTVSGGSGVYTYEFIRNGVAVQKGPNTVYIESDLLGGDYSVNVTDSNGCTGANVITRRVNPFISLDAVNVAVTAITCNSPEDINITVTTTGGTPALLNYTVAGTDNAYNQTKTNGSFTGLTIGNYIITVTNPATGCSIQKAHYVADPNTFEIKAVAVNAKLCFGASNGSVDLTFVDNQLNPTNDAGIFNYTITGPVPSSGTSTNAGPVRIDNLTAGQYTVQATLVGSPFCTVSTIFTISQPAAALTVTAQKDDITCVTGNNDGVIYAAATGGWDLDYQYQLVLNGNILVPYSTQSKFTDLSAGTYTVLVKDGQGCEASAAVQLVVPAPITFTAAADAPMLLCFDDNGGVIRASLPTGGQGSNYLYTLNVISDNPVSIVGPQTDPVFTGLRAGRYIVTVTDGFSCEASSGEIVISEPTLVKPTLTVSRQQTCTTLTQLTLSAVGGTAPYTYSTDGINTIGSFASSISFDVPVGVYSYYVKDANGCISFVTEERNVEPLQKLDLKIDVSAAVVKCKDDATASIFADAVGGLGNYVYTLLNNAGGTVRPDQTNGRFEDLAAGIYRVKVVSGDCEFTSAPIEILQPNTPVSAEFRVTNVTCFGANNGKLEIVASGGTGKIQYAISPDLDKYDSVFLFEKLAPGEYTAVAMDENGCYEIHTFTITQPGILKATELVDMMVPQYCVGDTTGTIVIKVDETSGTAPFTASIDNEDGPFINPNLPNSTFSFTGINGGQHIVYIKDANNCVISFTSNSMPQPITLNPLAEETYTCENDLPVVDITVTIDESIDDVRKAKVVYTLLLDGVTPVVSQTGNPVFRITASGDYTVRAELEGCAQVSNMVTIILKDPLTLVNNTNVNKDLNTIEVIASGGVPAYQYSFNGEPFTSSNTYRIYKTGEYEVIVRDQNGCEAKIIVPATFYDFCLPNYFTPNGDGQNDGIGPDCGALAYKNLTFDIFDRYGRVVAKYHVGEKWDGRYNGAELPTGDYWYVLKLNDEKDAREFVGHFTLYR
ncbi:T9SS type B sorting domain-containing protein [Flavobacterium reichenbachii]|nr:T9SS type B sorting domain-containing protein [Flavobacterium reichenbachii]